MCKNEVITQFLEAHCQIQERVLPKKLQHTKTKCVLLIISLIKVKILILKIKYFSCRGCSRGSGGSSCRRCRTRERPAPTKKPKF